MRLAQMRISTGLLAALAIGVALALVAFWLFNKIAIYYLAGSYVDEIARVFDINKYLANAILWVTFATVLFFVSYALSFSRKKRTIGE